MKKPIVVAGFVLVPALFILSGFYFQKETLSSLGYVMLIFYIIMVVRGLFGTRKKTEQ